MLSIKNLFVAVDNKEVVKGVSLDIRPGEIHALMGPNGSGKSSLAMAIAGHPRYSVAQQSTINNQQSTPKIKLDGMDITNMTPDQRARMGLFLAMQYPTSIDGITVEQLLRRSMQEIRSAPVERSPLLPPRRDVRGVASTGFGRTSDFSQGEKSGPSEKVDVLEFRRHLEVLAKNVGVTQELLHRSLNVGFSGGEKKRLEILQMLVLQPKYAILDETDSGLDIDALRMIATAVRNYVSARSTKLEARGNGHRASRHKLPAVLVITHYARLLKHLKPDVVHIMKEGQIVESGGREVAEKVEKKGYQISN